MVLLLFRCPLFDRVEKGRTMRGDLDLDGGLNGCPGKGDIWDTEPGMDRQGLGFISRWPHVKGGDLREGKGVRIFYKMRIFTKNTPFVQENERGNRAGSGYRGVPVRGGTSSNMPVHSESLHWHLVPTRRTHCQWHLHFKLKLPRPMNTAHWQRRAETLTGSCQWC